MTRIKYQPIRHTSQKLKQYNIDEKYTNFLRKIPNCQPSAGNLVFRKVYIFLAPVAGFCPFKLSLPYCCPTTTLLLPYYCPITTTAITTTTLLLLYYYYYYYYHYCYYYYYYYCYYCYTIPLYFNL